MSELFLKNEVYISPSLICLDMLDIVNQVRQLERNGVKMLHIDILDGVFSPSMPLGFELVKQLRQVTDMAFECHVMTNKPEYYVDELLDIGVQQILFHIETANHVDGLINNIHSAGVRAGVALKPSTSLMELEYVIEKCDAVLLMLINPGYASSTMESQITYASRKVNDLAKMINKVGTNTLIELDGRISLDNIVEFAPIGANIFVGGTTCLNRKDIDGSLKEIKRVMENVK